MDKLIEELEKAPQEIKDAGYTLHMAVRRLRAAKTNYQAWKTELDTAEKLYQAANNAYGQASLRWDVKTNTMNELPGLPSDYT